jgi:predicted Zn-dependent protease
MRRLILSLAILAGAVTSSASAHLLYDYNGNWLHVLHGRDYNFYNGADQQAWWDAGRAAQLDWHSKMNGSLRFYSSSHDASLLHFLDYDYGQTGWIGRSILGNGNPLVQHGGHSHLDMNTYYNFQASFPSAKQNVACHEIGHPVGLAHSSDATDCMVTPNNPNYPTLSYAHRDQLRDQYNATGH